MRGQSLVAALVFAVAASSPAKADVYWSSIATACTPDSASIQNDRYSSRPDQYIAATRLDPIALICAVPEKAGALLPHVLSMTYADSTGTKASAGVKAQLIRVLRSNGARSVVSTVGSDSFADKTTANHKSDLFTHVLDFASSYYYVRIDIDRTIAKESVRSIGVALESTCGDGIVTAPEACDDGNRGDGDGCSSACVVEGGFECIGSPSICTAQACLPQNCPSSVCGQAICSVNNCTITPVAQFTPCGGEQSCDGFGNCVAQCGDGLIAAGEQCDDGNVNSGDGCSWTAGCTIEAGYECSGTPSVCTLEPVLTVNLAGAGAGSVTSNPAGITCGGDCTESYASGTQVILTAQVINGNFAGWSGACVGIGACSVTMNSDLSVTANFDP
jgi:cysteine-rich repeat protein